MEIRSHLSILHGQNDKALRLWNTGANQRKAIFQFEGTGELEEAQACPEWGQMPCKTLRSKACGEQYEGFRSACQEKVTAFWG